jgi:putative acetyltransferase
MGGLKVRNRRAEDDDAIRALNDAAFGGTYESTLIDGLRSAKLDAIELVATDDREIVGHILFSTLQVELTERSVRALALAPMAVHPARQRSGIGSVLVRAGLDRARDTGWQAVIVLGHKAYYPRFGFSAARAHHLAAPFHGDSFMALDLSPGALDGSGGRVVYPAPFGIAS